MHSVHTSFSVHIPSGQSDFSQKVSVVPFTAGQTLLIEQVSGLFRLSQIVLVSLQTGAELIDLPGTTSAAHHFFPTTTVPMPGATFGNVFVFGQRTYILQTGPGGQIVLAVHRIDLNSTYPGTVEGQVTVSGEFLSQ